MFAALTLGIGASTASAQTTQNGLVNINLEDVTVQIPIGVAANVCDVNVALLATLVDAGETTECTALAESTAGAVTVGAPEGTTTQNGLINVNLSNVTVQAPLAVALNICDVNAAILATPSATLRRVATPTGSPTNVSWRGRREAASPLSA